MDSKDLLARTDALQAKITPLVGSLDLPLKEKELNALKAQMGESGFWDDPKKAQKVSQKATRLEKFTTLWRSIIGDVESFPELLEMAEASDMVGLEQDVGSLESRFEIAHTQALLSGEYDSGDAIISLHVGNGGQDAEDFTAMLMRMYMRAAEKQGWKVSVIDQSATDDGLRSATIEISGDYAYGRLQSEHGVHRLIRLSPFNAKNLRQTSFTRVEVMPVIDQYTDITLDPSDLRIDVFRSSGPGGQSVNTTDSAVRITYLPLGITVSCQNEKSQLQNKAAAMKVLTGRLLQLQLEQQAEELSEIRGELKEAAFGSQIRTYTLQPYKLVKDHRTDTEHTNPDKVLDGEIEKFSQGYLMWKKSNC